MAKKLKWFTEKRGTYYFTPTVEGRTKWYRLSSNKTEALQLYYEKIVDPDTKTVEECVQTYFESEYFDRLSPKTKKDYQYNATKIIPILGHLRANEVTAAVLSQYCRKVGYVANQHLAILSNAFNIAIEDGHLDNNPCRLGVRRPAAPKRIKEVSLDEIDRTREFLSDQGKLFVDIAKATSLRLSDILNLDQDSVRDDGLVATIQKRASEGRVIIYDWTPELRRLAESLPIKKSGAALQSEWRRAKNKAGVTDLRIHDIRRWCLQEARRQGRDAQQLADHASSSQTRAYLRGAPVRVVPLSTAG